MVKTPRNLLLSLSLSRLTEPIVQSRSPSKPQNGSDPTAESRATHQNACHLRRLPRRHLITPGPGPALHCRQPVTIAPGGLREGARDDTGRAEAAASGGPGPEGQGTAWGGREGIPRRRAASARGGQLGLAVRDVI